MLEINGICGDTINIKQLFSLFGIRSFYPQMFLCVVSVWEGKKNGDRNGEWSRINSRTMHYLKKIFILTVSCLFHIFYFLEILFKDNCKLLRELIFFSFLPFSFLFYNTIRLNYFELYRRLFASALYLQSGSNIRWFFWEKGSIFLLFLVIFFLHH